MPRRTKDAAITVLAIVNVALLCTVLGQVVGLPRADAQTAAGTVAGQFLAVAGQVQTGLDAQYIVDTVQQRLYVLTPGRSANNVVMQLSDMRDLRADFARQPTPTIPPRAR